MNITSTRFGDIEVADEKIITMLRGLIGFEDLKFWAVLGGGDDPLFMWLHSAEDPDVAVPICRPSLFYPQFEAVVDDEALRAVGRPSRGATVTVEDLDVLAVVTVAEDVQASTINLKAPLLLDQERRVAVQVVNHHPDAELRAPLFEHVSLDDLQGAGDR